MELKELNSKMIEARKKFIPILIRNLYVSGDLKDDDLKDEESLEIAVSKIVKKIGSVKFVIDHTNTLLSKAEFFYKESEDNYSRIFYATFFEHSTNELVKIYCSNNKLSDTTSIEIIKNVNIYGKLTWLLEIFNMPRFSKKYITVIKNLAEQRNSFIHYKWSSRPDHRGSEKNKKEVDRELEFKEIRMAVKYFKIYISKLKYKNHKTKIDKLLKPKTTRRK